VVVAVAAVASGAVAGPATAAAPQSHQSQFAALRHAPTAAVPAAVTRFVSWRSNQGLGLDASQTRRIAAPDGGSWDVTPGDGYICLFVESQETGACTTTANALAGRLSFEFVKPSPDLDSVPTATPRSQVGLLPDGMISTTATSRLGGGVVSAKANPDGLYRLSSIGATGAVTMHAASGRSRLIRDANAWHAPKTRAVAHAATSYWDGIPAGHGNGWAFYHEQYGSYATITGVDIDSFDGNTICGNTRDLSGGWGSEFFCSSQPWVHVAHGYNGAHRSGWAGPGGLSASVYAGVYEVYNSLG
jgi:hypothetical protein